MLLFISIGLPIGSSFVKVWLRPSAPHPNVQNFRVFLTLKNNYLLSHQLMSKPR